MRLRVGAPASAALALQVAALVFLVAEATRTPAQGPPLVAAAGGNLSNTPGSNSTKDQQQQVSATGRTGAPDPSRPADADRRPAHECSPRCSNEEFASILNKISLNVDILRDFQRDEALGLGSQQRPATTSRARAATVRPECIQQLVQMIKKLASGELEMKTLLEFASSTAQINLRSDLGYLRNSYAKDRQAADEGGTPAGASQCAHPHEPARNGTDGAPDAGTPPPVEYLLGDEPNPAAADADSKAQFLPKLVASVDQWLDTIERFTMTRDWEALMRVFNGLESILGMFAKAVPDKAPGRQQRVLALESNKSASALGSSGAGRPANKTSAKVAAGEPGSALVAQLERELPLHVQTVTGSLNQLFPWHVWPWNNVDLHSTVDTFMNHGIFAFSKTTAGPERRIDYLPQMLDSLFRSLQWDSFPKKCNDWSRMICDLELFYDGLAVAPLTEAAPAGSAGPSDEARQRKEQVRKLTASPENKLTQELVCIMFSSLSMQQFGDKNVDFSASQETDTPPVGPANQLRWDRQVRKALRLYKLSREALADDQWAALQKQLNGLWSQMKISDRVIMVGRIVQLLTNCHMPREILESALWKDIYKYKNALNQIGDIVIEELNRSSENGKFTIGQLAIGSKHFEDILTRFIRLLPRLLEALSRTITGEFPELVSKFFDEKIAFFKGPCKGHSLSELVPSLAGYRDEIGQLERLVCQQLSTKPSITMMQINNLTNEFLAMALNFTNLGGSFQSLPRLWTNNQAAVGGAESKALAARAPAAPDSLAGQAAGETPPASGVAASATPIKERLLVAANGSLSIIDELAANPRLAQIVAILQSSALDPPEVHAELPELDWVEAGTSVALFYESIQKLMSFEGLFVVFPEVADFQDELHAKLEVCKQMFTKFGKQDPMRLASYALDTVMPVALRTFQPLDSFHGECQTTFRDIFGETDFSSQPQLRPAQIVSRESRQWQCAVSATNFASFALNNLIKNFNSMLRNILVQMSRQRDLFHFKQQQQSALEAGKPGADAPSQQNLTQAGANLTACVLFDGSITTLMDNLPQLVDLALETVLISSTSVNRRQTLMETLCSFENTLDPLAEDQFLQRQLVLREAVCHLLHESSLTACADVLRVDQWTSIMRRLNVTWFETSAVSVEPSFRGVVTGVHEFLDLFGKVKPSSMSDGLLARVLNFDSYWTGLVNKASSSIEKYKERRFQVALQILMPIIYENLPVFQQAATDARQQNETRHALELAILGAKSLQLYLTRPEAQPNATSGAAPREQPARHQELLEGQLRDLFGRADRHSVAVSESLMRTVARNLTKLELLAARANGSSGEAWRQFCSSPVDTYLEFELAAGLDANKASLPAQARLAEMIEVHQFLCNFDWAKLEERLVLVNNSTSLAGGAGNATHPAGNLTQLGVYPTKQLVRVALTKWGQVIDLVVGSLSGQPSKPLARSPEFLRLSHWKPLQAKLPTIAPSQYDPTNFIWVWQAVERLVNSADQAAQRRNGSEAALTSAETSGDSSLPTGPTADALVRLFDQLNCALDTVKGGITWDNMVNIYQDRQDVLAAHATLNNGIALTSAGATTFLAHKKFQKFLNNFVKPRMGLAAFCEMRDKTRLESIFSLSQPTDGGYSKYELDREELVGALESFQEFICDTNLEALIQNINPISVCYQNGQQNQTGALNSTAGPAAAAAAAAATTTARPPGGDEDYPLAETIDRFFKLASLAVLDAKLVDTSDAKPPIFDKTKWDHLKRWWLNQTEAHQGNSGLALTLVRVFQTLDSINSEHVVWRAIFRSFHELSEVSAYLLRAAEMELQASADQRDRSKPTKLALIRDVAGQMESALKAQSGAANATAAGQKLGLGRLHQQQQLASTIANVMFPEVSNFITLRTFKQLRYIKSISDYFAAAPGAQELICRNLTRQSEGAASNSSAAGRLFGAGWTAAGAAGSSNFELIGYKLSSNERLYALLCHYHSSQWLTALNIVLSGRTSSLTKKVNYMTKYLSLFTKNYEHSEHLQSFIHGQQMENIEAVANKTVSYMIALSQPFRTLTISKISNISLHSIPSLLESIDKHLCASKYEQQQQHQQQQQPGAQPATQQAAPALPSYQLAVYEPKKPDIEVIICKLPSWNMTQVYNYFSENIDLQNMISLATQNNHTARLFGIKVHQAAEPAEQAAAAAGAPQQKQPPTCITPFKFASKWLKILQDLVDEFMSKASKEKIRKCLNSNKKSNSAYLQTVRYVKMLNSLLATLHDLTRNNSWPFVRKTWGSISYAILNQSGAAPLAAAQAATAASLSRVQN